MRAGHGRAGCHHGELLQGVFLDGDGEPCRGLVTLPLPGPTTRARFLPVPGLSADRVLPAGRARPKALRAARHTLSECARTADRPVSGGLLWLCSNVPVGLGLGSSTSDVVAAVHAVASAHGTPLDPARVARLAVRAERACDPLMLDGPPVLFAQRRGEVLEELAPLPPMTVLGCLTGYGAPVDTLALNGPAPGADDIAGYEELRVRLRRALAERDTAALGAVATESARRNQYLLPCPELGPLEEAATACGALGVQVSHSGNVAGVLFDRGQDELTDRLAECRERLRRSGPASVRTFRTPAPSQGESWTPTYPPRSAGPT
ncbi:GHMP family kinase ATP-binding protein [Nocardiopsis xinjiangensis]|uniref:GHMP family kinase ATP-binding protein n=1 Tax=Nocardiopsis xinjiangensis TaxID=124285 RepID=UPI00034BC2EC|nr:hypothetical protein [Nocardiopsis xinjiangensis]